MNSLGINKPKKNQVVVAMSGGVDSSVVAAYEARGLRCHWYNIKLYDDTKQSKEGRQCCAGQDILDAKVSENINIDHKIILSKNLNLK